jgi:hypothetical protein
LRFRHRLLYRLRRRHRILVDQDFLLYHLLLLRHLFRLALQTLDYRVVLFVLLLLYYLRFQQCRLHRLFLRLLRLLRHH